MFKNKKTKANKIIWLIIVILVVGVAFQLVNYQLSRVKVVLYGTSTDSVTVQTEEIMRELKSKFGSRMQLEINLVAREEEDGSLASYQTASEDLAQYDLQENIRQAVIKKYYPTKYLDYLAVRNSDVYNQNWQYFAQFAEIDSDKVTKKVEEKGEELLKASVAEFEEKRQGLDSSVNTLPLLYINDEIYTGSVDYFSLAAATVKPILRGWRDHLPEKSKVSFFNDKINFRSWTDFQYQGVNECYNNLDCNDKDDYNGVCQDVGTEVARCLYSEPAQVKLTILNDEDCATCDTDSAVASLQADFKGLQVNKVDTDSAAGEKVLTDLGLQILPVYLFDQSIEQAKNFSAYLQMGYLGQIAEPDDYYYVLVQSGIPGALLSRELQENQLDLYVMSQCPYAVALENSLIELKEDYNFDLKLHFVLQNQTDEQGNISLVMASQNGEAELAENKRQIVIQEYYPDQFLDYLEARNKDISSEDWQSAVTAAGLNPDELAAKVEAEGEELLRADAQASLDLGINSAPAYLWENRYFGFGLDNLMEFAKFSELEVRDEDKGFCINTAASS